MTPTGTGVYLRGGLCSMQDLNALGPRLQLDLLRDWSKLALDRELWRGFASRC